MSRPLTQAEPSPAAEPPAEATSDDPWSLVAHQRLAAALSEHAPTAPHTERMLAAAIAGVANHSGKLLRARLVLAAAYAQGVDDTTSLALATAVEYFHMASLVLDDLPCMDDALTRRGQPCVHRVHGEATAILTALAFINRAYALAGFALADQPVTVRLQAHACLDACLGAAGLLDGQARDLRFSEDEASVRAIGRVALGKTVALLRLALLLPALAARPTREELRHVNAIAIYWGLAFQALDDLRDVVATSVDTGKTTNRDRALGRPNLAVALGVPAARARATRLLTQADVSVRRLVIARPAWRCLEAFQRYFADAAMPFAGKSGEIAA